MYCDLDHALLQHARNLIQKHNYYALMAYQRTGWNFSKAQTTFAAGKGSDCEDETVTVLTPDKFAID